MAHLRQNSNLVVGELTKFGSLLKLLDFHNFDGKLSGESFMIGSVYVSILSWADLLQKYVILYNFIGHL
jgi:hypothetical protein